MWSLFLPPLLIPPSPQHKTQTLYFVFHFDLLPGAGAGGRGLLFPCFFSFLLIQSGVKG